MPANRQRHQSSIDRAAFAPYRHVVHFSIRQLLLLTTLTAAAVAAAAKLPTLYGTIALLVASLMLPGALATVAASGGPMAKSFCLPALVPLTMGLYAVGWALGWCTYQSAEPSEMVEWLALHGRVFKAVLLSAWACGAAAGLTCVVIYQTRRRAPRP
jgi:hypothetical protein